MERRSQSSQESMCKLAGSIPSRDPTKLTREKGDTSTSPSLRTSATLTRSDKSRDREADSTGVGCRPCFSSTYIEKSTGFRGVAGAG